MIKLTHSFPKIAIVRTSDLIYCPREEHYPGVGPLFSCIGDSTARYLLDIVKDNPLNSTNCMCCLSLSIHPQQTLLREKVNNGLLRFYIRLKTVHKQHKSSSFCKHFCQIFLNETIIY